MASPAHEMTSGAFGVRFNPRTRRARFTFRGRAVGEAVGPLPGGSWLDLDASPPRSVEREGPEATDAWWTQWDLFQRASGAWAHALTPTGDQR